MKEAAEHALQAKNLPLDVAIECLTLRESRRAIDVVKDPVEDELHKEVEVIDMAKKDLQQKVSEAFEQLWWAKGLGGSSRMPSITQWRDGCCLSHPRSKNPMSSKIAQYGGGDRREGIFLWLTIIQDQPFS